MLPAGMQKQSFLAPCSTLLRAVAAMHVFLNQIEDYGKLSGLNEKLERTRGAIFNNLDKRQLIMKPAVLFYGVVFARVAPNSYR